MNGYTETGDLNPANPTGIYKNRQVGVVEHVLGGYRLAAKENSPFTSFGNRKVASNYGRHIIEIDLPGLRKAIQSGEVTGVVILSPKQVRRLIKSSTLETDHWKNLALKWATRDNEYLIRGVIPEKFVKLD